MSQKKKGNQSTSDLGNCWMVLKLSILRWQLPNENLITPFQENFGPIEKYSSGSNLLILFF